MTQKTPLMLACRRAFLAYFVGAPLFLVGCGGGASQDDMRRHAIRRTRHSEESAAATPDADVHAQSEAQPEVTASPAVNALSEPAAHVAADAAEASKPAPRQPTPSNDAATNSAAATTRVDAVPSPVPPAEPLSPAERRKRTADNLTQIGAAWRGYLSGKRCFPGPITNATKEPLLSWRVELLPDLGLQSLYDAFHLDEAWDSPHNIALLDKIPGVFQSPERFDTKTNYLALSLAGTTVYQERRKVLQSNVEDGIENTLALVEVDEAQAVPWTQPAELRLAMATPLKSLGALRENGLFVVWSSGKASWIDGAVDPQLFTRACTIDSGDGFRGSQIAGDLAVGIAIPADTPSDTPGNEMVVAVPNMDAADAVAATAGRKWPTLNDAQTSVKAKGEVQSPSLFKKQPIPAPAELKIARELLRELYQEDYAAAQTAAQRLQLARKILDRLPDLSADIPGQYALLEITKQISIQAGGVDHALDAADHMAARFELPDDPWIETFEKLARVAKDRKAQERLIEEADSAFEGFVLAQQYEAAERMSQLAISTAHKVGDPDAVDKFTTRKQWAGEAKVLHQAAEEGLAKLDTNPEDPLANCDVGKFLCLIKNDWENGPVILANGNDRSLKRLAQMEISDLSDPLRKLELADLWWREAASASPGIEATMQSRAKYWYEQSLPGLPSGLVRIRVERRIDEFDQDKPDS